MNLIGKRFGKLTVTSKTDHSIHGSVAWLCKCDCGNILSVRGDSLQSGKTVSCGCSKSSQEKIEQMYNGRKIADHTSPIFFKGTVSKNSITGINGVTIVKGKYRAYIGYKNKLYHLIETDNLDTAKYIRSEAEATVKNGNFEEWILDFRKGNDTPEKEKQCNDYLKEIVDYINSTSFLDAEKISYLSDVKGKILSYLSC